MEAEKEKERKRERNTRTFQNVTEGKKETGSSRQVGQEVTLDDEKFFKDGRKQVFFFLGFCSFVLNQES